MSRHHREWHQLYAKEKVCYDTALGFSFDGVYAKEVWVCFHKFDAMGTMQLCTLSNGCLHCVVVRQWVSRSSISVFLYLTLPKSDVKQLKHDIEWMPERTCVHICLAYATCQLNVRKATPKSLLSDDMLVVWDAGAPRTCRDRRIVDQIVSEAYMFATCETLKLVAHKEPMTKLS